MSTEYLTNKNHRQQRAGARQRRSPKDGGNQLADQAQRFMERGNDRLKEMIEDHEGQTILASLAIGFGIGVALGFALGGPSKSASSRWIDRATAEGVGRKMLERIDQMLPSAISSRLHG